MQTNVCCEKLSVVDRPPMGCDDRRMHTCWSKNDSTPPNLQFVTCMYRKG